MFSKDISQSQYRTPRTLSQAFGPYATLSPSHRKVRSALAWIAYPIVGFALGVTVGAAIYGLGHFLLWVATK